MFYTSTAITLSETRWRNSGSGRLQKCLGVHAHTCVWGAGFTHRTLEEVCVYVFLEEETGRRLAFPLTLNSECSNLTALVEKSEKKRKSCGPQLVSYRVCFWSLFQFDRNHFKKIRFVKVWARKNHVWDHRSQPTLGGNYFRFWRFVIYFFLIFSIQFMLISTVYDTGLTWPVTKWCSNCLLCVSLYGVLFVG